MYTPTAVDSLVETVRSLTMAPGALPAPERRRLEGALRALKPHRLVVIAYEHEHGVTPSAVLVPQDTAFTENDAKTLVGWEEGDYGIDLDSYTAADLPVFEAEPAVSLSRETVAAATQTLLVTAQAEVHVPERATLLEAANGDTVGFVLDGVEYRPLVGFDMDGADTDDCLITDSAMRQRGIEVVTYTDETGVLQ